MTSKLEKTANRIASRKKNANEYSLAWFVNEGFQQSRIQTGINNAVNKIIIKAKPSIPKIKLILTDWNQWFVSKNWNCVIVGSKKNNKPTQTLRIMRDQKREKLRIKFVSVLFTNNKTKQPNRGIQIRKNNIEKILRVENWTHNQWKLKKPTLREKIYSLNNVEICKVNYKLIFAVIRKNVNKVLIEDETIYSLNNVEIKIVI